MTQEEREKVAAILKARIEAAARRAGERRSPTELESAQKRAAMAATEQDVASTSPALA